MVPYSLTASLPGPCNNHALIKDGLLVNTDSTLYGYLEYKPLVWDALLQFPCAKERKRKLFRMNKPDYFTLKMLNGTSPRQNTKYSLPVYDFSFGHVGVHLTLWSPLSCFLLTLSALLSHDCI